MNLKFHICNESELVTSEQMKEIERKADESGLSYYQMMENAGTGAAEFIVSTTNVECKKVLILCGKGNNGGDGFVVARKLYEKGALVQILMVEGEPKTNDSIKNMNLCKNIDLPIYTSIEEMDIKDLTGTADIIVDAIYGTGFRGELRDKVKKITRGVNSSEAKIYSLDIPSGLNGDTGEADADTIRADYTIAFHRMKPAHKEKKLERFFGKIICISIGIEEVLK